MNQYFKELEISSPKAHNAYKELMQDFKSKLNIEDLAMLEEHLEKFSNGFFEDAYGDLSPEEEDFLVEWYSNGKKL